MSRMRLAGLALIGLVACTSSKTPSKQQSAAKPATPATAQSKPVSRARARTTTRQQSQPVTRVVTTRTHATRQTAQRPDTTGVNPLTEH